MAARIHDNQPSEAPEASSSSRQSPTPEGVGHPASAPPPAPTVIHLTTGPAAAAGGAGGAAGGGFFRSLRRLFFGVSALAVVAAAAYLYGTWQKLAPQLPAALAWRADTHTALEVLRREPLAFLVTERVITQVVFEVHEGNLLVGYGDGYLFGKVELLYGVDLEQLDPNAIVLTGDTLHVRVPEPKLLRYVPDLLSLRFIQKRTALLAVFDQLRGNDRFQTALNSLAAEAEKFARDNRLTPSRAQLVDRLNGYAPAIQAKTNLRVVFE